MLDDLVGVIATLQGRIRDHGDVLRQNEIRTRVALIDPLLQALGWDVANPGLAIPEYEIGGQRVDYALLGTDGKPAATVEAKKLGENLAASRMQMLNYSNAAGIAYAGLTDGNQWELYEVFKQVTLEERRLLDLRILDTPAHECALKLLLLWQPNLATGRPVAAGEPIISPPVAPAIPTPAATVDGQTTISLSNQSPGEGWIPLADIQTGGNVIGGAATGLRPSAIRLPDGRESSISNWWHVPREVAEYLIRTGNLTPDHCPLGESGKAPVVTVQHLPNRHELSNGCSLTKKNTGAGLVNSARFLLQHCGVDAGAVWLKLNP